MYLAWPLVFMSTMMACLEADSKELDAEEDLLVSDSDHHHRLLYSSYRTGSAADIDDAVVNDGHDDDDDGSRSSQATSSLNHEQIRYAADADQNVHPSKQLSGSSSGDVRDRYGGVGGVQAIFQSNPLLAALYLSSSLGIPPVSSGFNHAQHLPINPYVALLLSHYGRYLNLPPNRSSKGIYGYTASNNYHNNKPFGAYKVQEDA